MVAMALPWLSNTGSTTMAPSDTELCGVSPGGAAEWPSSDFGTEKYFNYNLTLEQQLVADEQDIETKQPLGSLLEVGKPQVQSGQDDRALLKVGEPNIEFGQYLEVLSEVRKPQVESGHQQGEPHVKSGQHQEALLEVGRHLLFIYLLLFQYSKTAAT